MIIDMHAHIWVRELYGPMHMDMIKACRENHIDRLLISALFGGFNPDEKDIKDANAATLEFCKKYPDLVRGMIYLNPYHDNCVDIIREYLKHDEMVGIKLWVASLADEECVNPIMEEAIAQDVPVLFHAWHKTVGQLDRESTGEHVANIARRYPEAKIIMAHLGGNYYHGIKAIRDLPNVYTDFSGSTCERDAVDYAIKNLGVDRVLYGTDLPGSIQDCLAQVDECCADKEGKEKIYYKNAQKLFRRLK